MEYPVKVWQTIETCFYIDSNTPKEAEDKDFGGKHKPSYNADVISITSVTPDIKAHGILEKVAEMLDSDWKSRVTLEHNSDTDREFVILRFKQSGCLWANELKNILSHYGGFLDNDGGIVGLTIYEKKKGK